MPSSSNSQPLVTSAEHVIVGSGAGGALTAALLAEARRDVLVIEEGPQLAPGAVEPFSVEQMVRQYRNGGVSAALGRPPVAYVEGCCVGGSTEVNAGLYHVADEATLARWRASNRVAELTPEALAPHATAVERDLSVQRLPGRATRASLKLAEGAEAVGLEAIEVPRWFRYETGVPVKQSMAATYLPRAEAAGARLRADTSVRRILIRDGRAAGVQSTRGLVTAEHVWLCAGAIGTAALLQRSGLRPAVGTSLKMHPTVKLVARFAEPVDGATDVPVHQVKPPGGRLSFGGSASRPGQVALALSDDWKSNRMLAGLWPQLAVYYAALRPEGKGKVLAVPGLRDPLVTFALTRADMRLLGEGLAGLARLLFAAGAEAVYPSVRGGGEVRRTSDVDRLVAQAVTRSRASVMTVHLFSTVPLGEDEVHCPVDSFGAVRGVRNLRVNDASLLPDAPGVNPQGTVMALARRNVAHFLASGA